MKSSLVYSILVYSALVQLIPPPLRTRGYSIHHLIVLLLLLLIHYKNFSAQKSMVAVASHCTGMSTAIPIYTTEVGRE